MPPNVSRDGTTIGMTFCAGAVLRGAPGLRPPPVAAQVAPPRRGRRNERGRDRIPVIVVDTGLALPLRAPMSRRHAATAVLAHVAIRVCASTLAMWRQCQQGVRGRLAGSTYMAT